MHKLFARTPYLRISYLVLFVGSISVCAPVCASRYELIKGRGVEVCEAYGRNLNSFNDPRPMICERKINPTSQGFEKPQWHEVSLAGPGRELLRRILNYQYAGEYDQFRQEPYTDRSVGELINDYNGRHISPLGRTSIDIDNDGKKEEVLIYRHGFCPDTVIAPHFATNIFVIKSGPKHQTIIDSANSSEQLLRTKISPGSGELTTTGLFRYGGKTYIDKYCAFANKFTGCEQVNVLLVFEIEHSDANHICSYKYQRK